MSRLGAMMRKAEEGPVADTGCAPTTTGRSAEHSRERANSTSPAPRRTIGAELLRVIEIREAAQAAKARKLEAEHHRQWYATRQKKRRAR